MLWWDNICKKCGKCCCEKKIDEDGDCYIFTDCGCAFLDMKTKKCVCYTNRFKNNPLCKKLTIFHALFANYLPEDCAYVQKFRFWKKHCKFPIERNIL